jgi:hypothetical protein
MILAPLLLLVQAPQFPYAHVHAEGVVLGVPWVYDQEGFLQGETVTPSPFKGYQITAFDFAGRDPDLVFHSDETVMIITFPARP